MANSINYPYIPNSNPAVKREMLDFIGVKRVGDIYSFIPSDLRMKGPLDLPKPLLSELELKKHVDDILNQNGTCGEYINFLGAGCYDHYVPALCDEINGRSEFLTAYTGGIYSDHGKNQCIFEFSSMMGELLDMDVVSFPTYDGAQAACTAIMMAKRITGRSQLLYPANINPDLLRQIECYCVNIEKIPITCKANGQLCLTDLKNKLSEKTICVFIQNPNFLGFFEEQGAEISEVAHAADAEFIVSADPSTLGIIAPPVSYGADIACGEIQPLGIHMSFGSGLGGYLATRDEEKYIMNLPHHLYALQKNDKGEFVFWRALSDRTSYNNREKAVEFLGTCVGLWVITAAVYLAVMGPEGLRELGENILYKSNYAQKRLASLPGLEFPYSGSKSFMEFVVSFNKTGKTVSEISKALLNKGIFGGYDLSKDMPELGQAMLICVTEKTQITDIDALMAALKEILG
jgi:glycine dehydrogenase subunit 1